jgi:hypothetical protein
MRRVWGLIMNIEELLKEYNGMVGFGFKGIDLPDNDWREVYRFKNDWDIDRVIICSIILLLKKHCYNKNDAKWINNVDKWADINGLFLIHDNGLYLRLSCWEWDDSNYLYDYYYHSHSWLSVKELVEFDYEEMTEDRRCTVGNDGVCTYEVGKGEKMSYREFLGEHYFKELAALEECGCTYIVFWFDN